MGCGCGRFLRVLADAGYSPTGVDVAENCLDADVIGMPFIGSAVTDLPDGLVFDAVVCSDVMEHIPPEMTRPVLAALARLAPGAVIGISNYVDDGKLHCNVEGADWWKGQLSKEWPNVSRVKVSTSHYRQNEKNWFLFRVWR